MLRLAAVLMWVSATECGAPPPAGLYAIIARLELPHLERWAVARTEVICLDPGSVPPVPVLNEGLGLGGCPARAGGGRRGRG